MLRAALYVRVSTKDQAQRNGTRYQQEELKKMASARGWKVVGIFADEGYSGRKEKRPGLDGLMSACERGEVDVVAVWRFDRFARSLSHLVRSLTQFQKQGIQFVSQQEGIDTSTSMGLAMFQIAGAFAELESNLSRERIAAGLASARARGVKLGRPRSKLTKEQAIAIYAEHGSYRRAAKATGIAAKTLFTMIHS